MDNDKKLKMNIRKCARCGEDHDNLVFFALTRPFETTTLNYRYWAPCPTNGQPILCAVYEDSVLTNK